MKALIYPVVVKAGFVDAGRKGRSLGEHITVNGMQWTPVLWDDEEDPEFFKSFGLDHLKCKEIDV